MTSVEEILSIMEKRAGMLGCCAHPDPTIKLVCKRGRNGFVWLRTVRTRNANGPVRTDTFSVKREKVVEFLVHVERCRRERSRREKAWASRVVNS
jgi:hypothetical protein